MALLSLFTLFGILDQGSKLLACLFLSDEFAWTPFGKVIHFRLVYNHGAFLSLGGTAPGPWHWLILVWTCLLLLAVLAYGLIISPTRLTATAGIGLIFAGGASNLIDRLLHHGSVVDFVMVNLPGLRGGVFNLADLMIAAGFLLFAVSKSSEAGLFSRRGIRQGV
jgi:signal peptidase II